VTDFTPAVFSATMHWNSYSDRQKYIRLFWYKCDRASYI